MSITHWPKEERPREKLLAHGPEALSDAELLAIFLRIGVRGKSALDLARELLSFHGSLRQLLLTDLTQFCEFSGMGPAKYAQLQASLEMAKRFFKDDVLGSDLMTSSAACKEYLRLALKNKRQEIFACLFLDTQHKVLSFEELFQGTLGSATVYPREVVRRVLEIGAAAVIFCHNHPSGSDEASEADIQLTSNLSQALSLIDVKVLDHFIVAGKDVISLSEQGLWVA